MALGGWIEHLALWRMVWQRFCLLKRKIKYCTKSCPFEGEPEEVRLDSMKREEGIYTYYAPATVAPEKEKRQDFADDVKQKD